MSKRFFLVLSISIICFGGVYFFYQPKLKVKTQEALDYMLQGNYSAAETTLNRLSSQKNSFPLSFYRGFLEQARGEFNEADFFFQKGLEECTQQKQTEARGEILFAQAMNAYFEGHQSDLLRLIKTGKNVAPEHPFIPFFEGLANYQKGEYSEAMQAWFPTHPFDMEQGSGWLSPIMNRLFSLSWRRLHIAHCLMEKGNIEKSREILEKESRALLHQDQELNHLATLFLGLSYLKEAARLPLNQRDSYYKLACFYFERAQGRDLFPREYTSVITHIQQEIDTLLFADLAEEQHKWGFNLVRRLEGWDAEEVIDQIAHQLAVQIIKHKAVYPCSFCQSIHEELLGSTFHRLLGENLMLALTHRLREEKGEDLIELWERVESLSSATLEQVATLSSEELFNLIQQDGNELTCTLHYIAFWKRVHREEPHLRERLARDLLTYAKLLWQKRGYELRGEKLMELALSLTGQPASVNEEIKTFLRELYAAAESSNLIERLTLVYEAMEHFQVTKQPPFYPAKLANYLADAEYHFHSHNYTSAKTHALWVLKHNPENEQARKLAGLSSFYLGEYAEALSSLTQLSSNDDDVHQALMISQVFATQQQEKHLAQINHSDSFKEDQ